MRDYIKTYFIRIHYQYHYTLPDLKCKLVKLSLLRKSNEITSKLRLKSIAELRKEVCLLFLPKKIFRDLKFNPMHPLRSIRCFCPPRINVFLDSLMFSILDKKPRFIKIQYQYLRRTKNKKNSRGLLSKASCPFPKLGTSLEAKTWTQEQTPNQTKRKNEKTRNENNDE